MPDDPANASIGAMSVLPAALLDPAAYPQPPASVELRETHISWVFLAGERAYKVKKPVSFPFLDYGTLERRRECCLEELRLNRRFAPDVYLGVVAIVARGPGRVAIASADDPYALDYAVEMRRYDERETLAAQLPRLQEPDLVAVGRAVAGFHAAAEPATGARSLTGVVEETLATLAGAGVPGGRVEALAHFLRAALHGFGPELERRTRAGRVRDGHGDLRAEHVLVGERTRLVDGVEFDASLRVADVAYDLAFLVMDVARRDDDLARALVRGYRAGGGDPGSDRLLALLCAIRALVRAKVDLLRAAQLRGAAADERAARGAEALAVAERFAWRARLPRVVCVIGHAASGKSTLAEALAAASGRTVLSSDRTRKLRAGVDPYRYAGADAYGDPQSRAVYEELGRRAARSAGGAIVDATFRRRADADAFVELVPAAGWIVCDAPPAVLLERARTRALRDDSVSDAGPEIVAAELARYGRIEPPAPPLARVETTRPVPELLHELALTLDAGLYGIDRQPFTDAGRPTAA
jgi:aminoglycoside phosphotransferase family enzyme/predicted kinase